MTRNETPRDDAAPARQRIAKLMARVGLCSRRDAEAWIVEGRVSLNGSVLTSPATDVGPDDAILVDGAPLPAAEKTRLFLFHKPRGFITSDNDPEGRATVADYLREHWPDGPRVVTIGRLDINTEGLLLLTNDGGLARLLELPKTGWVRRYRVRAKGETHQGILDGLRDGVSIEGIDYAGIEATLDRTQGANVWLTMALREGKNREVKRVLEHIGLEVNRLIRLSFGPFQLGDLPEGSVEEVRTRVLRDQLGTALAAAAGVSFEGAPAPVERKPARSADRSQRADSDRPARPEQRGERRIEGRNAPRPDTRGGDRPLRRPREEPEPRRERPAAGSRKHVTTLRSEEADIARRGPRRRIERGDVKDRRDRTIAVERMVGTRPLAPTRTRDSVRPAPREDAAPRRPADRRPASPSALAKRARIERSGSLRAADADTPRAAGRDASDTAAVPRRREQGDERKPRGRDGASRRPDREGDRKTRAAAPGREARASEPRREARTSEPRREARASEPRREARSAKPVREGGRPGGASRRDGPAAQRGAGARDSKDRQAVDRDGRKFGGKRPERGGERLGGEGRGGEVRAPRRADRSESPRRDERAGKSRAARSAESSAGRRSKEGDRRKREPGTAAMKVTGPKRFGGGRSEPKRGAITPRPSAGRGTAKPAGRPSGRGASGKPPARSDGRPPRGKPRPKS